MADFEKILLITAVVALIAGAAFSIANLSKGDNLNSNFNKAVSAQDSNNKCVAPAGYTQQEWEEHMGHHPELYKECF